MDLETQPERIYIYIYCSTPKPNDLTIPITQPAPKLFLRIAGVTLRGTSRRVSSNPRIDLGSFDRRDRVNWTNSFFHLASPKRRS